MDDRLLSAAILIAGVLYVYFNPKSKQAKEASFVKDCLSYTPGDLYFKIRNICTDVPPVCVLEQSDYSATYKIMSTYQNSISDAFNKDQLNPLFLKRNFTWNDSLMLSIYVFLDKHIHEEYFNEYAIYTTVQGEEDLLSLTDFGISYTKLYYAVLNYCAKNSKLKDYVLGYHLEYVERAIRTKIPF